LRNTQPLSIAIRKKVAQPARGYDVAPHCKSDTTGGIVVIKSTTNKIVRKGSAMDEYTPSHASITAETDRRLRRLSVILAAQLPGDCEQAQLTLRYMSEIVQSYTEPSRVISLRAAAPLAG